MNAEAVSHIQKLRGKAIFLSASVPSRERSEEFRLVRDARVQIEEAVVSLARSILAQGGKLIFGGHPSISPLVGLVAAEYAWPRAVEGEERHSSEAPGTRSMPLIEIYQSEAFRGFLPDETWQLFQQGFAAIKWTKAVDNERFDPEIRDQPQCSRSLATMRQAMIENSRPVAMVCIGGMEGVLEELEQYRKFQPSGRVYVFENTGGAASIIAREKADVRVVERLQYASHELHFETGEHDIAVIPYPIICQLLVDEIAGVRPSSHGGMDQGR